MITAIKKDILAIIDCDLNQFGAELDSLISIRKYDEYTYLHCLNVARLSVQLGERLGFDTEMLIDLGWAALLHDLGKLRVPLDILNKVKSFSATELAIMQSHPLESISTFSELQPVTIDGLRRLSAAFEHHQRYDLKGYPRVKTKLHLHPFSRIVAVTDTFDAMTTDRIYQRRVLPDVALKIMSQGFGTIFDPLVLQAFITCMGVYPVNTLVRLSDGNLGIVINYHEDSPLDRPVIRLLDDSLQEVDLADQKYLDLKIVRSEFPEDNSIDLRNMKWK